MLQEHLHLVLYHLSFHLRRQLTWRLGDVECTHRKPRMTDANESVAVNQTRRDCRSRVHLIFSRASLLLDLGNLTLNVRNQHPTRSRLLENSNKHPLERAVGRLFLIFLDWHHLHLLVHEPHICRDGSRRSLVLLRVGGGSHGGGGGGNDGILRGVHGIGASGSTFPTRSCSSLLLRLLGGWCGGFALLRQLHGACGRVDVVHTPARDLCRDPRWALERAEHGRIIRRPHLNSLTSVGTFDGNIVAVKVLEKPPLEHVVWRRHAWRGILPTSLFGTPELAGGDCVLCTCGPKSHDVPSGVVGHIFVFQVRTISRISRLCLVVIEHLACDDTLLLFRGIEAHL
mmetsp:Transcript_832/g.2037  ORF Transcript_832/g.2037 Transcript_832/m.2037 type:complete len:342 (-) Transcript_832:272-1297(-)